MNALESQEWESFETGETSMGEWGSEWETVGEFENFEQGWGELESEQEMQELALASELLEISSEEELEQFLGKLIKGAAKAVGGFVKSPVGKALGGVLKNVAKTALPMAAGALGNLVLPGVGGAIGSKLGSMATKLFEVELEGMNEQEAEFEIARRYVRFATAAARNAARAPGGAPPRAVARAAAYSAARRHAPGLLRGGSGGGPRRGPSRPPRFRPRRGAYAGYGAVDEPSGSDWGDGDGGDDDGDRPRSGRWLRRGQKIVLLGV